ncbi:MAG: hypothetical protein HY583_02620 [Candidatus Omnitrophica bacterium]|nr:hypothetical protein [Candidatus Omnitrophota bacterium]
MATAVGIVGVLIAFIFYRLKEKRRKRFSEIFSWIKHLLERKYYMDDLYNFILRYIQEPFARFLNWFERKIVVEGAVNQTAALTAYGGQILRKLQTGRIQTYLSIFCAGIVILIYLLTIQALH